MSRTTKTSASKNAGRSTTGEARVPYYRQADHIEAAKHLRLTVTRYIADRAALREVEEAMVMLRAAAPVAGERGARHASDCDCTTCAYSKKHPQLSAPRCWEPKPAAIRAAIEELRRATRPEQRTSYERALNDLADLIDQLLATTDDRGSIKFSGLVEQLRVAVPRRKESA